MSRCRYDSTWMPEFTRGMILHGATDEEIALALGVSVRTMRKWRKEYQEFGDIFRNTDGINRRKVADCIVEAALFKRATGFEYSETKKEIQNGEIKKVTETIKHQPPDLGAQKYWLACRLPERWNEKTISDKEEISEIEHVITFDDDDEKDT